MYLRTVQDWIVRPQMKTVPGVAGADAIGGFVKQFQVQPDPAKLVGYGLSFKQVIEAIERTARRNMAFHRSALDGGLYAQARQDFIWSLMPGPRAGAARERLEAWKRMEMHEFAIEFEADGGEVRLVSVREL